MFQSTKECVCVCSCRVKDVHAGWSVPDRVGSRSPSGSGGTSAVATQVSKVNRSRTPAPEPEGSWVVFRRRLLVVHTAVAEGFPVVGSALFCARRCKPKLKLRIINQNSVSVLQTPAEPDTPTEQDHKGQRSCCDSQQPL